MTKLNIDAADNADWLATEQRASKLIISLQESLRLLNNDENSINDRHELPDADCMDLEADDEVPPPAQLLETPTRKRQPLLSSIDQKARMELYMILQACTNWPSYAKILNLIPRNEEFCLAIALNDSPERFRSRALAGLDYDKYARINGHITEIQCFKEVYDPKSVFPSVVSARTLFEIRALSKFDRISVVCHICRDIFEDSSSVIWKMCGKEAMHESCFKKEVTEGKMPLFGPCHCLNGEELVL